MTQDFAPVRSFSDLTQFGINALTGEACAYSMRVLCDVNEDGKALLADYFGMPDIVLAGNWNSMVGDKPAVGSIMLQHGVLGDLAQFAFFRAGAIAVVTANRQTFGIFQEERLDEYRALIEAYPNRGHAIRRNFALSSSAPREGSRNVHAMSGRAV